MAGKDIQKMGIYLVIHKYVFLEQQCRNTFYYTTTVGEPSDAEWQDVADEIRADFVAEMRNVMTQSLDMTGIDRRRVDQAGLLTFSEVFTAGIIDGDSATDPLPTQIALLVGNKGSTTKPNRARTYLTGWTEAANVLGLFGAGSIAAAEAFIDLQSDLNAGGTNPLQRVAAQWNSSHTQVIVTNDLSGAASVGQPVPATQRRRRIGVGI